jgi:HAD superfamily hydrolase (TIGR01484 family)
MPLKLSEKKLIVFDLDGTLAPSKSPIDKEMGELLAKLLESYKVAVISGGMYSQFQTQFLHSLPHHNIKLSNLIILPTSGTRMYIYKGEWQELYAEDFSKAEKEKLIKAFDVAMKKGHYMKPQKIFGEILEDRDSQFTFSGLGQKAPIDLKEKWDPDRSIREAMVKELVKLLPEFDIRIGGATSIDITKRGVNKSYGIRKLEIYTNLHIDEMLFVGDALYVGGNDYPARATGVDCIQVSGPEESKEVIRNILVLGK